MSVGAGSPASRGSQYTLVVPPGRLAFPRLRELWEGREVLYRFGLRDVVLRYRQTAIGVAWVLIQPLAAAGIFALIFGQVAKLSSQGVPYFAFTYVGMLAWNLFSGVVTRSAPSLVGNQQLVSKVFFPRMLVPLSTVLAVLLDFVVAMMLAVVLLIIYRINPGWPVLLVPLWALLVVMVATGIGLVASALMVRYRDIGYFLPWAMQILLYASPVAYSVAEVPSRLQLLFSLNPITWFLEEFRYSLLAQPAPQGWHVVASIALAVVVLFGGAVVFQSWEREFADII
jgi:lipopolysaccharide transport system permease protein